MTFFWEIWQLYHKCVFDGVNRLIIITPGTTSISVREDIYSAWKEWVQVENNGRFLPAIRVTGGDPIGQGAFTGDVYFLVNDWRIYIDHTCNIDGVIYSDDYPSPYIQADGTQIVINKVSSLVSVVTTQEIGGITVPTPQQIRQEIDNNSVKLDLIVNDITNNAANIAAIKTDTAKLSNGVAAEAAAQATKSLLSVEMSHLLTLQNGQGLDSTQATMLLEIYRMYGLDPTRPLIVTQTSRTVGSEIIQTISGNSTQTTVTRTDD